MHERACASETRIFKGYCAEMASSAAAAPSDADASRRVLSIQSHVVHGHVGNKSAVFPLQLLGFEVDPICSVQFSNHTGYPTFKGQVLQGHQLSEIVQGLEANELLQGYSHMLTGYIGSVSFLQAVLETVRAVRAASPDMVYFCDPVMGDNGKLYVPEELVQIYREEVLPLASVITPNQFEAEQLTQRKIRSEADAVAACEALHARGPHTVVLTSFEPESLEADGQPGVMMLASHRSSDGALRQWRLRLPQVPQMFTGSGDLVAALLLAWTTTHPGVEGLPIALEKAGASMQAVLARTHRSGRRELCLVQSRADFETPQVVVRAEPLQQ